MLPKLKTWQWLAIGAAAYWWWNKRQAPVALSAPAPAVDNGEAEGTAGLGYVHQSRVAGLMVSPQGQPTASGNGPQGGYQTGPQTQYSQVHKTSHRPNVTSPGLNLPGGMG